MEFHLYFGNYPADICLHSYDEVKRAIVEKHTVHTTQVSLVGMYLLLDGYRVFIHPVIGDPFEVVLGDSHKLRVSQNLEKLLVNGIFDSDSVRVTGLCEW